MTKAIPYAVLKSILERLGFQATALPEGHIVFSHSGDQDRLLIYRAYRPDEGLDWADLAKTGRFLDAWGILDEEAFESLLQETAA